MQLTDSLAIYSNDNLPNSIFFCKSRLKILPKAKLTFKHSQRLLTLFAKVAKFCQFGHTDFKDEKESKTLKQKTLGKKLETYLAADQDFKWQPA